MRPRWALSASGIVCVSALVLVLGCAAEILAQPAAPPVGDVVAGSVSPWSNAHFVLYAYAAILIGVVAYVWRLARLAARIQREVQELGEFIAEHQGQ